jgi:hypothetical protein
MLALLAHATLPSFNFIYIWFKREQTNSKANTYILAALMPTVVRGRIANTVFFHWLRQNGSLFPKLLNNAL